MSDSFSQEELDRMFNNGPASPPPAAPPATPPVAKAPAPAPKPPTPAAPAATPLKSPAPVVPLAASSKAPAMEVSPSQKETEPVVYPSRKLFWPVVGGLVVGLLCGAAIAICVLVPKLQKEAPKAPVAAHKPLPSREAKILSGTPNRLLSEFGYNPRWDVQSLELAGYETEDEIQVPVFTLVVQPGSDDRLVVTANPGVLESSVNASLRQGYMPSHALLSVPNKGTKGQTTLWNVMVLKRAKGSPLDSRFLYLEMGPEAKKLLNGMLGQGWQILTMRGTPHNILTNEPLNVYMVGILLAR